MRKVNLIAQDEKESARISDILIARNHDESNVKLCSNKALSALKRKFGDEIAQINQMHGADILSIAGNEQNIYYLDSDAGQNSVPALGDEGAILSLIFGLLKTIDQLSERVQMQGGVLAELRKNDKK